MKKSALVVALLLAVAMAVFAQTMPRMTTAEPGSGKIGDVITVAGENLSKASVEKVYLTDGKNDTQVTITWQTATEIKFKLPAGVTSGARLALMLLTAGKDAKLIEQPVKVTIN